MPIGVGVDVTGEKRFSMEEFVSKHPVSICLLCIALGMLVIAGAIASFSDLGPVVGISLLGLAPLWTIGAIIVLVMTLVERARDRHKGTDRPGDGDAR